MLDKFFNVNEVEENQFDLLKEKDVLMIQEKQDGSLIRFISLPDGSIVAKTKLGFTNSQAMEAMQIYNKNKSLQDFVKESLDQNLAVMFELVSPFNKIVIDYNEANLIALQMRDEETGKYLDIYNHNLVKKYQVKLTEKKDMMTLDYMMNLRETLENTEGFIVTFADGHKAKVKTKWYFDRHKILDASSQENEVIEMVLEETLDDAISILDASNPRRKYAEDIQKFLGHYISKTVKECQDLLSKYNGSPKDFALTYNKGSTKLIFALCASCIKNPNDIEKLTKNVKNYITKECYRLMRSKKFLADNGFKVIDFSSLDSE